MSILHLRQCIAATLVGIGVLALRAFGAMPEPTGGLVEVALAPSEMDQQSSRRIRLLLDPQASPPIYYPSVEDLPQRPRDELPDVEPLHPFKTELIRIGAEASIYLSYSHTNGYQVMKILRFSTMEKAESYWLLRRTEGDGRIVMVSGEEFLSTSAGRRVRPGTRTSLNIIECKTGRYVIRVASVGLRTGGDDTSLALKQVQKIRKLVDQSVHGAVE